MRYGDLDAQGRLRVTLLADAAAEAAFTPPDGSIAYRVDLAQYRFRVSGAWVGLNLTAQPGALAFGANAVGTTTTTRFLYPWLDDSLGQTAPFQYRIPFAGVIRRLRVHHNAGNGNGNLIVYTLRVNSVATALAVSMASTAVDGSDLVNAAAVAAGDLLDLQVTKALGIGSSPNDIAATMEFAAL